MTAADAFYFDGECADCDAPIVKAEAVVIRRTVNGFRQDVHICTTCDDVGFPSEEPPSDVEFDIWREEQAS